MQVTFYSFLLFYSFVLTIYILGSSLYLKSKFGVGYLLTMVKNANFKSEVLDNMIKEYPHSILSKF